MANHQEIFNQVARRECWSKCNVLAIAISINLSGQALHTNVKLFSNYWPKTKKNILTNIEAWILIKVQCFIYQWIRLDKVYKFLNKESLFLILYSFSNYWPKTKKIFKRIERREYWSKCNVLFINGHALQTYESFFFKFQIHISNWLQIFNKIVALCLCKLGWEGICADQHAF